MPSYKNFQTPRSKHVDTTNQFLKPKENLITNNFDEERMNQRMHWITFYRRNMHRFVEHYLGIKLYPYQKIWLYLMSTRDSYVVIASRAVGKTWLLAVFALARAILYPNSEIVVVSSTKEQAGTIISDKITSLRDNYPNIAREIKTLTTNMNKWQVDMMNGSIIKIVAARDSSRGKRSTFTILEEFRLIPLAVLDSIIRPFSYIRQTPYLKMKEYSHLEEEPREVFISSAFHKNLWGYKETIKTIKDMLAGKNSGFIAFDYSVALNHHIKTRAGLIREISKMDSITAQEEYFNVPFGENSSSYFKLKMFERGRTIDKAFYPQRNLTYNAKKNPYNIPKSDGEIRIVSCDIAQRSGKTNDLALTSCTRLLPTHKGYQRELVYMESFSGENSIKQTLRIKQVFYDFDADVIVLDVQNAGISVLDLLGVITKDSERGLEYPAMTVMPHESIEDSTYQELYNRTLGVNALPVIYPISATAKLNSIIAVEMRDKLQKKMWGFLVNETEAEDYLIKSKPSEFLKNDDPEAHSFFMHPYIQTSLFVNECINLSMQLSAGNIKLVENPGNRKDRYTSVSYANHYISYLDAELMKQGTPLSEWEAIESMTFVF
jgi:hypothetical protein